MTDNLKSLENWIKLAAGALRNITPEEARAIGGMCRVAQERGENCAVWHQSSIFYGHKCCCAKCSDKPLFCN
jgi:hypothetical protein